MIGHGTCKLPIMVCASVSSLTLSVYWSYFPRSRLPPFTKRKCGGLNLLRLTSPIMFPMERGNDATPNPSSNKSFHWPDLDQMLNYKPINSRQRRNI